MDSSAAITLMLALLAAFLVSITIAKYAFVHRFTRIRFVMSALFIYIVATLTVSFWNVALATLPYTIPVFFIGMYLGHRIGVGAEEQKISMMGIDSYMQRFAHITHHDIRRLNWWSFINFYSIMCGLVIINLVGLTTILLDSSSRSVIFTSIIGAAFIGSIVPYLTHLWLLPYKHRRAAITLRAAKRRAHHS